MNAAVQSKVNNKRLELGQSKCFKLHVGDELSACPKLSVHGKEMITYSSEKYLCDILSNNGKMQT